jgi:hypothetical protein
MSKDGLRLLSLRERKEQRDLSEIKRARWFASAHAGDFGGGLREVCSEIKTLTIAHQPHTANDFGGRRARAKTQRRALSIYNKPCFSLLSHFLF